MKIVFLNAWAARVQAPLREFIEELRKDTDVFCFQEVYGSMPALCDEVLTGYTKLAAHKLVDEDDDFYLATYVNARHIVLSSSTVLEDDKNAGLGLYVQLGQDSSNLYICNFHGMSRPVDKHDTASRLKQSLDLIGFFEDREGSRVLGGDFNVFPTNESIKLYQQNGYRDLIHDFGVTNTRNRLIWDRFPENKKQYFSDYAFVSADVRVDRFTVPDVEVSDHLPLILEITV